ncbi:hypothetical protein PRtIB026_A51780 [Pseudomonas sp. RtIB026]|nr:hypothetical protein PRtIB026_A51780 [Pseudomonas sp. RtIB026]
MVTEYALAGIDKPVGAAKYQLLHVLPEPLGRNLPSIVEIGTEVAGEWDTGSEVE